MENLPEFEKYHQKLIPQTCLNFSWKALYYGLAEEVGELMGILKRIHRGDDNYSFENSETQEKIIKEAGDICWYATAINKYHGVDHQEFIEEIHYTRDYSEFLPSMVSRIKNYQVTNNKASMSAICNQINEELCITLSHWGIDYQQILTQNIDKLEKRLVENTIKGSGDR